ncbi:zygote arrest protein 1-like isoform X2 [Pristis pectinata]|uniref:zygote arrest protein 1-like isoform X2 n=1 Tax=Pristis pectinata TaxID=685728 RepID=UPI00223DA6F2|nr:zygote arrest protein 1-like isoform X2 [Pristis pectinata]
MCLMMEGFVYSPLNTGTYSNGKPRQQNWRQRHYPQGTVEAVDYLDNYKRAQLKAILSQVNPNLTPRLRKANTKEIGIQVNPKVDASVQCSLGPRTLPRQKRHPVTEGAALRARSPSPASATDTNSDPEGAGAASRPPAVVRFSRPVAMSIYSPVFDRRLGGKNREREKPEVKSPPEDLEEDSAPPQEKEAALSLKETVDAPNVGNQEKVGQNDQEVEGNEGKQRFRFQFLEQKYGYYHCKDCNIRWESAYVWCISGTNKYFLTFLGLLQAILPQV